MIAETTSPAASVDGNAASSVSTRSGLGTTPHHDLGGDPERPLGADERAGQVERAVALEPDRLAVGEHDQELRARAST